MLRCPKCSARNPNDSKFCNGCGTSLDGIEPIVDSTSVLFNKASSFLDKSAKRARETAGTGIEKAKQAVAAGKEKISDISQPSEKPTSSIQLSQAPQVASSWSDVVQETSQQNSSWDNPVNQDYTSITTEKYPFFQDEDEKTIAVIGGQFAAADLGGTYQAPYAILTQKKLYCKNEAGYFIKDASKITTMQMKHQAENYERISWFLFGVQYAVFFGFLNGSSYGFMAGLMSALFMGAGLFAVFYFTKSLITKNLPQVKLQSPNIKLNLGLSVILAAILFFFSPFGCVVVLALGILNAKYLRQCSQSPKILSVFCPDGTFSFMIDNYPQQEISNFIDKAIPLCQNGKYASYRPGNPASQKSPGSGKAAVIVTSVIMALFLAVGGFWYFSTHCKAFGCDRPPVIDGYCRYHYGEKKVNDVYNDAEDFLSDLLGK